VTTGENFEWANINAGNVLQAANVTTFTQLVETCCMLVSTAKTTANLTANSNCCKQT